MNYRDEILKFISLEELEKKIQTKKAELPGLLSTWGCEYLIAKELGIQIETIKRDDMTHLKSFSEEILFERFKGFIDELKENNNFLEILSGTLGEMLAHNKCCHKGHNIPNIEDIDFNKLIKEIKTSFYEAKLCMNDEWYFQLDPPVRSKDTDAYEGNKEHYEQMLKQIKIE